MNNEELFDKFLNDTMSPEEQAEFESRLQDEQFGQELVAYTVEVRDFVHMADKLEKHDARKTVKKLKTTRQLASLPRRRRTSVLIPLLGIAALLALSVWYLLLLPGEISINSGSINLVSTGSSPDFGRIPLNNELTCRKKSLLEFKDGSSVTFDPGSVFVFTSFEPKSVRLISGGFRASVNKQLSGSFSVTTQDGEVNVLGTEFSVNRPVVGRTTLLVDKGKVSIANEKDEVVVEAGEAAIMDKTSRIIKGAVDRLSELRWRSWQNNFVKDKDLKLYVTFESGLKNLAQHKYDNRLKLLKGQSGEGRFKSQKAMSSGIVELLGSEEYLGEAVTVFAWVKPGKLGVHSPIMTKGDFFWRMQLGAKTYNSHIGYGSLHSEGVPVEANKWSFVTAVFNGDSATLFVNGRKTASVEKGQVSNKFPIQIGGNATAPERVFKGLIDEAGLFERALSENEILDIYNNSRP